MATLISTQQEGIYKKLAWLCYLARKNFCDSSDMHALIVMPRPLSVNKETIIIVLYYSVQSEVSAVRKLESPLVGSFFFVY